MDSDQRGPTDQWPLARARVDRIVRNEDPEGLLAMGAPDDEYRPEVDGLTGLVVRRAVDADSVLKLWEHWFGPGSALSRSTRRVDRLTTALVDLDT